MIKSFHATEAQKHKVRSTAAEGLAIDEKLPRNLLDYPQLDKISLLVALQAKTRKS